MFVKAHMCMFVSSHFCTTTIFNTLIFTLPFTIAIISISINIKLTTIAIYQYTTSHDLYIFITFSIKCIEIC